MKAYKANSVESYFSLHFDRCSTKNRENDSKKCICIKQKETRPVNINPGLALISLRRSVGFPGPHLLIKHSVCDRGFCGSRELTKMDGRVLSAP